MYTNTNYKTKKALKAAHRWYVRATLRDGIVVSVK